MGEHTPENAQVLEIETLSDQLRNWKVRLDRQAAKTMIEAKRKGESQPEAKETQPEAKETQEERRKPTGSERDKGKDTKPTRN